MVTDSEIEINQISVKNSQKHILQSPLGESNFWNKPDKNPTFLKLALQKQFSAPDKWLDV